VPSGESRISCLGALRAALVSAWRGYSEVNDEEKRSAELKPASLLALLVFGLTLLGTMHLVPAAREFTGFDSPWPAVAILLAAIGTSFFGGLAWRRKPVLDVLMLVDTSLYCLLICLLMVQTVSPVRYVFGLVFGQVSVDYGRRVPFNWPMFAAVGLLPTAVSLFAWPDFAVVVLVVFGAMMFVFTSLTTAKQWKLQKQNAQLQSAFRIADQVATNSVDIALAATAAEMGAFVHHLRNALTPVVNHLLILSRSETLAEADRFSVGAARRGADRSVELLENLVATIKRRSSPRQETFSVAALIGTVVEEIRQFAPEGARLVVPDELPAFEVRGNPDQLRLAIENLLRNAFEAGATRVELRTRFEGGTEKLVLVVRDDGPGIPPDILDRLLRQPVTHGKRDGHGFGLYFSRRLIELLGGSLTMASTGEGGTHFEIVLPGRPADRAAPAAG
jgi:signal transduction histidine kinase